MCNGGYMFMMSTDPSISLKFYTNGEYERVKTKDGSLLGISYWKVEGDRLFYKHDGAQWFRSDKDEFYKKFLELYTTYAVEEALQLDGENED